MRWDRIPWPTLSILRNFRYHNYHNRVKFNNKSICISLENKIISSGIHLHHHEIPLRSFRLRWPQRVATGSALPLAHGSQLSAQKRSWLETCPSLPDRSPVTAFVTPGKSWSDTGSPFICRRKPSNIYSVDLSHISHLLYLIKPCSCSSFFARQCKGKIKAELTTRYPSQAIGQVTTASPPCDWLQIKIATAAR
jgi:hypothetical protein